MTFARLIAVPGVSELISNSTHRIEVSALARIAAIIAGAAVLYFAGISRPALGASEAWSVVAANASDAAGTVRAVLQYDPGKPPLYHLTLHFVCALLGDGEATVRGVSAIFGLCAIAIVYLLGARMWDASEGSLAALLLAICPIAFLLARWARMYSAFIALVALTMMSLWMARENARLGRLALLAIATAAMLYVHMGALIYLGAALLICARDAWRGRPGCWKVAAAVLCGVLLFSPFIGIEVSQARSLLLGHWLDWAGAPSRPGLPGLLAGLSLGAAVIAAAFVGSRGNHSLEPIPFCLIWCFAPCAVLLAISLAARPVLELRYVAPSIPPAMLVTAFLLMRMRAPVRQVILGAVLGIFAVGLIGLERDPPETWRKIAARVANAPAQPVFFERGLVVVGTEPSADDGSETFPDGYYRAAFDYYYKEAPRFVIDSNQPDQARAQIASVAQVNHGAWLVSGKPRVQVLSELPQGQQWEIMVRDYEPRVSLWHIQPCSRTSGQKLGP